MKIVRCVCWLVVISLILIPHEVTESGDYEQKIVKYVALGDSIAGGYGLQDAASESYVGRVAEALEERYGAVSLVNFGKNGQQSGQLLSILSDEENEKYEQYREALQGADLITLSIGSNDLLHYLSAGMNVSEFRENGDALFSGACEQFGENIAKIIDILHRRAPDAQLVVNNIYNPCRDISFHMPEQIAKTVEEMSEKYIGRMNQKLEESRAQAVFSRKGGGGDRTFTLIDVKQAFERKDEKLINVVFSLKNIDPHPNREGHRVIAEQIIPQISLER